MSKPEKSLGDDPFQNLDDDFLSQALSRPDSAASSDRGDDPFRHLDSDMAETTGKRQRAKETADSPPLVMSVRDDEAKQFTNLAILAGVILFVLMGGFIYFLWLRPTIPADTAVVTMPSPQPTATPTETATPRPNLSTPTPPNRPAPTPSNEFAPVMATPPAGGQIFILTPPAENSGWVSGLDEETHFDEPNIHVGFLNGHIYYGALQFDLSDIPVGAPILEATLALSGLSEENLAPAGKWQLRLLKPEINQIWPAVSYEKLQDAETAINIVPALNTGDLGRERVNYFPFGTEQLAALEQSRANSNRVAFRIDGPGMGDNNLFTWDNQFDKPTLRIVTGPREYVIVTSTATPENALTAVAAANTATPTTLPANWVTPLVVEPSEATPTPGNEATAEFQGQVATAMAMLNGTPTPTPLNVWTATPTSTNQPTPTPPLKRDYVVVTSTPTPENVVTVAALAMRATYVAQTTGTYTPVPENWATPIVVTPTPPQPPTPVPGNAATAEFQKALATAQAILHGPESLPGPVWTATPTPIYVAVEGDVYNPWQPSGPNAQPTIPPIPVELVGKIAFLSNRSGGPVPLEKPVVYAVDPDGTDLIKLTDTTFYELAKARDHYSADQRYRAFVKIGISGKPTIYFYDYHYQVEQTITVFGRGLAWDPAWSPTNERIVFTSNDSGDDEIWAVDRDGSDRLQLTLSNVEFNAREIGKDTFVPEINGSPSWSPDGTEIVFHSTRTGRREVWIMNADGSNPRKLSRTPHEDWQPVWIKYTDPPREPIQ